MLNKNACRRPSEAVGARHSPAFEQISFSWLLLRPCPVCSLFHFQRRQPGNDGVSLRKQPWLLALPALTRAVNVSVDFCHTHRQSA